jgi:N6-L-threonylcarbamoyladenine synthase
MDAPGAILAIETSCDETCAAVVDARGAIRANVVSSQAELHDRYGGVVPEVASRRHLELVGPVVRRALGTADLTLRDVDRIAVTAGPGLVGALLVGVAAAKAYAYAARAPLVPVDHLHGHLASLLLEPEPLPTPFLALLASGGHTLLVQVDEPDRYQVVGRSLDDAAGEAFDKGARLLGLGYPGGAAVEAAAVGGDPDAFPFPAPLSDRPGFDFSFSGLKTALLHRVTALGDEARDGRRADLCASYQSAIVRSLADRTLAAALATGSARVGVVGGVAANGALRRALAEGAARHGLEVRAAPLALCGDNAAMIASAARFRPALRFPDYLRLDAYARAELGSGAG